ncbi:effector-associated constant component EACC1 [Actinoplanes sp. URMC 104]|uniref:effector-associated constant component EACC1 n=1 Tax=Actinoplanes sp. URMC 104 TaxID=3423409 RepID=UPI003F196625
MTVTISVAAGGDADDLRALRSWLAGEPELRGRVSARETATRPDTLGPVLETLLVALGPGGAAAALVTGLVSWLRQRNSDVTVRVERADGSSFEVSAQRVRGLDADALRAEVASLAAAVGSEGRAEVSRSAGDRQPDDPSEADGPTPEQAPSGPRPGS